MTHERYNHDEHIELPELIELDGGEFIPLEQATRADVAAELARVDYAIAHSDDVARRDVLRAALLHKTRETAAHMDTSNAAARTRTTRAVAGTWRDRSVPEHNFTCGHCGRDVPWGDYHGVPKPRNCCPFCLWSQHVEMGAHVGYPPCGAMMRGRDWVADMPPGAVPAAAS